MNSNPTAKKISRVLRQVSHPARIRILLTIGEGETCVCHLEAALGYRQAYISQHLMALRKAGLLQTRREGRFIYYRLSDVRLLSLLETAATLAGPESLSIAEPAAKVAGCGCPACTTRP